MPNDISTAAASTLRNYVQADRGAELLTGFHDGNFITANPVKAPSRWERFKAAMYNVPLLCRLHAVSQAHTGISNFQRQLRAQVDLSEKFSWEWVRTMSHHYGETVMSQVLEGTKLKGRQVHLPPADGESGPRYMQLTVEDAVAIDRSAEAIRNIVEERNLNLLEQELAHPEHGAAARITANRQQRAGSQPPSPSEIEFIKRYATLLARENAEFGKQVFSTAQLGEFLEQAMELHDELSDALYGEQATAAMTLDERAAEGNAELTAVLDNALRPNTRASATAAGLRHNARVCAIESQVARMLNYGSSSVLQAAVYEEKIRAERSGTSHSSFKLNSSLVEKAIGRAITDDFSHRVHKLAAHLQCSPDAPTVILHTRDLLVRHVQSAVREHYEAVDWIESSSTLSEEQKQLFFQRIERGARLDGAQVNELQRVADEVAKRLPGIENAIRKNDAVALFDHVQALQKTFHTAYSGISKHAETMWLSRSLDGDDIRNELFNFCIRLGLAGEPRDAEAYRQILDSLTAGKAGGLRHEGDHGISGEPGSTPGGPDSTPGEPDVTPGEPDITPGEPGNAPARTAPQAGNAAADGAQGSDNSAVSRFMQACDQSASMEIAALRTTYAELVLVLADLGGLDLDAPAQDPSDTGKRDPQEPVPTVGKMLTQQLDRRQKLTADALDAGLLDRCLLQVPQDDEGMIDTRGVMSGSPWSSLVAPGFDVQALAQSSHRQLAVAAGESGDAREFIEALADTPGISLHVNGQQINLDAPNAHAAFRAALPAGQRGDHLSKVLVSCLHPSLVQGWDRQVRANALGHDDDGNPPDLPFDPSERTVLEAKEEKDGSWTARFVLTVTAQPKAAGQDAQASPRHRGPLSANAIYMTALTHAISAESLAAGNAQAELAGARAVFAI